MFLQEMQRSFDKGGRLCKPGKKPRTKALDMTDSAHAREPFEEQMNPESSDLEFPTLWFRLY